MSDLDFDKMTHCPVLTTIQVLNGKWKPRILWIVRQHGHRRFGELKRDLLTVSEKMLSHHLSDLEKEKVIQKRDVMNGKVRQTEYSLTQYGKTLIPVLEAMGKWGINHQKLP